MAKISKAQQIKNHLAGGDELEALKVAKGFFYGFTKEEKRSIDIAFEANTGKKSFYERLGVDVNTEYAKAIQILKSKFND